MPAVPASYGLYHRVRNLLRLFLGCKANQHRNNNLLFINFSLGNSSYSVTIKNPAVNLPDCYDSTNPWKGAYKTMFVLPQDYSQFRVYFTVEVDGVARPEECAYFDPYNSGNPCCLYLLDVQFK